MCIIDFFIYLPHERKGIVILSNHLQDLEESCKAANSIQAIDIFNQYIRFQINLNTFDRPFVCDQRSPDRKQLRTKSFKGTPTVQHKLRRALLSKKKKID